MTVHRTPIFSAILPMTMPPSPNPTHASEVAKPGTDRSPAVSAAIDLRATMVIHGAPNDSVRITSTTVATVQEALVSTDCKPMGRCINFSCFLGAAWHRCRGRRDPGRWACGKDGAALSDRGGGSRHADERGAGESRHQRSIPVFSCADGESIALAGARRGRK